MSDLNSINSSQVAFSGLKKSKKAQEGREEIEAVTPKKSLPEVLKEKISEPIVDEFHKAYDGQKATPTLVADFVADNAVKLGVAVLGGALFFAKSRKATNGLTTALRNNFKEAFQQGEKGVIKKIGQSAGAIRSTITDIKKANFEAAKKAVDLVEDKSKKTGIIDGVKQAILKSEDSFAEGSKLPGLIDSASARLGKFASKFSKKEVDGGKIAEGVKGALLKVGIKDGGSIADTAIATGATYVIGSGANGIASDVTEKDNAQLAKEAKIQHFEQTLSTIQKLADTADMLMG